jgi:hypothetical protein
MAQGAGFVGPGAGPGGCLCAFRAADLGRGAGPVDPRA